MKRQVSISAAMHARVKAAADARGVSIAHLVDMALAPALSIPVAIDVTTITGKRRRPGPSHDRDLRRAAVAYGKLFDDAQVSDDDAIEIAVKRADAGDVLATAAILYARAVVR